MDIKQELRQVVEAPAHSHKPLLDWIELCRDALAEIESYEKRADDVIKAQKLCSEIMRLIRDFGVANQAMALKLAADLKALSEG
jgi:hypothetical protein